MGEDDELPTIPESAQAFLREPVFAHFATLNEDGSPSVSTMWVDTDGTHIILNSPLNTGKVANVKRDPRVAMDVVPQEYPTRALWIRGRVTIFNTDDARDHIETMSWKYRGQSYQVRHNEEPRILLYVLPEVIEGAGLDEVELPGFFKVLRKPGVK